MMNSLSIEKPNSNWTTSLVSTNTISEMDSKIEKPTYIFKIIKDEDDGRFIITCPNLQGVVTDGKDEIEALKNGIDALNIILEARNMDKEYYIEKKY